MILIQIGGLGLITMTIFLMSLFVNFGFATQLMAGQLMQLESWQKIKNLILFIIGLTLSIELIGAFFVYIAIHTHYPTSTALFLSVFHAISSFCNAGIGLNDHQTLFHASHPIVLTTTLILMLSGGLGFITWTEIFKYLGSLHEKKKYNFSLHSKIVLHATAILLSVTSVIIFWLERNHAFAQSNPFATYLYSLFHAVSFRSGGLLTVPISEFHIATLFLALMIAFIGSSPGSTGSGIKITTLAIFFAAIKTAVSGRTNVEIKGRSIPLDQVNKCIAIVSLSLAWITLTTFLLLAFETEFSFFQLFFEAISAFTTLGISTKITASLSIFGKIVIMMSMIIGRIGSLTLILALRELKNKRMLESTDFSYPEERVILM
jgi:trk system potassium uptake protein TrkH